MKAIAPIFLLAILPCFSQTTNVPPSPTQSDLTSNLDSMTQKRDAGIKYLRELLSDPKVTTDKKAKATVLALQLLDLDSQLLGIDRSTINQLNQKIEQLGGNPAIQSLFPGSKISFTTLDGKTFKDAKISSISSDSFSVITPDGGATVQMDNIDKDLQNKFSYQPPPIISQAPDASTSPSTPLPQLPPSEPAPSNSDVPTTTISGKPLSDGLNIVGVDAKVMRTSESGDYLYIAWKVTLYDKGTDPINNVSVTLSYRDKDNFEVESSLGHALKIDPGQSFDVTGQEMMKPEEWAKVTNYSVETN